MNDQAFEETITGTNLAEKRPCIIVVALVMIVVALMGVVATVNADGATQISGVAFFPGPGECEDVVTGPNGQAPDFGLNLTGDLEGCLYVFVETFTCTPSGMYIETGTELYVGSGNAGDDGTFETSYQFTAMFEDCPNLAGQINGRCQHPIAASSGTGDFEGVTGRLDFKDDVDAGNAPYKGHLSW